ITLGSIRMEVRGTQMPVQFCLVSIWESDFINDNLNCNKMRHKFKTATYILLTCLFVSCSDFLAEEPHSFLAPENYYQGESEALAALTGAYIGLGDNSNTLLARRLHYLTWFTSDDSYPPRLAAEKQLDNFTY